MEHATGLEKRELDALAAGNDDPFDIKAIKRNAGTLQEPNLIPSAFQSRIVGCICKFQPSYYFSSWRTLIFYFNVLMTFNIVDTRNITITLPCS